MNKKFKDLTIISISYNNEDELLTTLESYDDCLNQGASSIVINGGRKFEEESFHENVVLIEEEDEGIFDALNKGVNLVKTKYLILIHSGDKFTAKLDYLEGLLKTMNDDKLDLILGNQTIPFMKFKRKHSSNLWSPFFLKFGAQPPHMPTIYRKAFINDFEYDKSNKVIADFFYFKDIFSKKPKWSKYSKSLIEMGPGGNTTNGFSSFILVSKQFIKNYGVVRGTLISLIRIPFKFIQMI
jgi:hypothetical protein